jgi:hypothetical protein
MGDLSACKSKRTLIQLLTVKNTHHLEDEDIPGEELEDQRIEEEEPQ